MRKNTLACPSLRSIELDQARPAGPKTRAICRASPDALDSLSFESGSMGPKVEAACEFVERTGGMAGIGRIVDALAILRGEAGTVIAGGAVGLVWWD